MRTQISNQNKTETRKIKAAPRQSSEPVMLFGVNIRPMADLTEENGGLILPHEGTRSLGQCWTL